MKHFLVNTRALLPSTKAHWLSEMQFLRSRLGLSTNNLAIVFYCTLRSLFGQNLGSLSTTSFFGIRTMDGWFLFSSKIFCSKKWLIDLAKSLLTMLQKSWKKVALYPLGRGFVPFYWEDTFLNLSRLETLRIVALSFSKIFLLEQWLKISYVARNVLSHLIQFGKVVPVVGFHLSARLELLPTLMFQDMYKTPSTIVFLCTMTVVSKTILLIAIK